MRPSSTFDDIQPAQQNVWRLVEMLVVPDAQLVELNTPLRRDGAATATDETQWIRGRAGNPGHRGGLASRGSTCGQVPPLPGSERFIAALEDPSGLHCNV
jgi:hypothetical protein